MSTVQGRVFERLLQACGVEEFNGPQGRILYVLSSRPRALSNSPGPWFTKYALGIVEKLTRPCYDMDSYGEKD